MQAQHAREFMYGGKATFTLKSVPSQKHYTFRMTRNDRNENMYFVSLLTASDDYTYIGLAFRDSNRIIKPKAATQMHPALQALDWYTKNQESSLIEFFHEGRCAACGRPLTTPTSITLGFGPICAGRKT